ncbi:MAG: histidine phosphatase family protein [Dehalococcoidia bacterium]
MRLLYLVRHASPRVDPAVPTATWELSPRGAEEARALARVAVGWNLRALYCSSEAKARGTALMLGGPAGLVPNAVEGLEELRIDDWIANADEFAERVRRVLEEPELSHAGAESAVAAAARFAAALDLIAAGPFPAAAVTHGRVLTAYLSGLRGVPEPFALWRSIPMPAWAIIDLDAPRGLQGPFRGLSPAP